MNNLDKVIANAKKLIDLSYNRFSLENYDKVLLGYGLRTEFISTNREEPISLMSGNNAKSGILKIANKHNKKRNIYVVGKGILFDSGGLDLKTRGLYGMSGDKAGAIIALAVADYCKENVVAYCPITTNFIQTSKITTGDEIKIGKTRVLVTNTDAEGRLILAEAISNLNASKDDIIITVATLTGCCEYAVDKATGVFSVNNDLLEKFSEASFEAEELAWALPMFSYMQKYYNKQPIRNSVKEIQAGASEGAMFLKQFVPNEKNWIHLDIASSSSDKDYKATGVPIKSLLNFIKKL